MKVLITGATGLIGKELTSLLLQNGIQVNYLTTSKKKIKNEILYKGFFWNPENGIIDKNCLDEVDAVIHLAGASISKRWTDTYKEKILESRVVPTHVLFSLLKNTPNQVKQLISASAIGIYPNNLEKVYSEDSKEVDNSFLGKVVQKWEEEVDQFTRLDIKVCKIRTGLVLSKNGGVLKELTKPIKFGLGSPFGSGRQMQSWIHIEDLVNIYYFALLNNLEGVYNAVAPYPVTNSVLIKTTAKVLQRPVILPNVPKIFMKAILGEMHMLLFSSQRVSAKKIIAKGYQFKHLSLERALQSELIN